MVELSRRLAEGLGSWLQFETNCNRSGLFSERYLAFAVGQLLGAVHGSGVLGEHEHSVLAGHMKGPGKRPRLDFVAVDDAKKVIVAIETKWIGRTKVPVTEMIWDLIRLELMAHHHGADAFFILAGKRRDLDTLFESDAFRGPKTAWDRKPVFLHRSNAQWTLPLLPVQPFRIALLREVFESRKNLPVPAEITIRRSTPFPPICNAQQHQVYVWKVSCANERKEFRPTTSAHYRVTKVRRAKDPNETT